jgi:hypothetical protein
VLRSPLTRAMETWQALWQNSGEGWGSEKILERDTRSLTELCCPAVRQGIVRRAEALGFTQTKVQMSYHLVF